MVLGPLVGPDHAPPRRPSVPSALNHAWSGYPEAEGGRAGRQGDRGVRTPREPWPGGLTSQEGYARRPVRPAEAGAVPTAGQSGQDRGLGSQVSDTPGSGAHQLRTTPAGDTVTQPAGTPASAVAAGPVPPPPDGCGLQDDDGSLPQRPGPCQRRSGLRRRDTATGGAWGICAPRFMRPSGGLFRSASASRRACCGQCRASRPLSSCSRRPPGGRAVCACAPPH